MTNAEFLKISKDLTLIEQRSLKSIPLLRKKFSKDSLRKSVCFTGPAGVGKSSLISALAPRVCEEKSMAWLACDPSSPESGGSLLGDRIRFSGRTHPSNLFIRSLSTRSSQAFSRAIRDMAIYLESEFDTVWIETAGSGQTQSEVARLAALTVLVLQPETGDDIQWMKSGVREWADLFVINKADLGGAEAMALGLEEQGISRDRISKISASTEQGLDEFLKVLAKAQKQMNWSTRAKILHRTHSRDLFLELRSRKLEKDFEKQSARWLRSPYEQAEKML